MDRIEVFGVGADGELIPIRRRTDRVWAGTTSIDHGPDSEPPPDVDRGFSERDIGRSDIEYKARPGQRPGGYDDRKGRSGGREDVVAPVPVLPGVASHVLHDGSVFTPPIPGIEIELTSLQIDARGSTWAASVRCGRLRPRTRRATLRAYPSPSSNLTILELVPTGPRLVHTGSFVNAGVEIVSTLGRRLTQASARSR